MSLLYRPLETIKFYFGQTGSGPINVGPGSSMPRSRRRHHSRSRSRTRSHSHDRDRDVKRRKIEVYDSPNPKRSVSAEPEVIPLEAEMAITTQSAHSDKHYVEMLIEGQHDGNADNDNEDTEENQSKEESCHMSANSTSQPPENVDLTLDDGVDSKNSTCNSEEEIETSVLETSATNDVSVTKTDDTPKKHLNEVLTPQKALTPNKTLTPKQLQKKQEAERKRQEKLKEREERERKKNEERLEKERQKREKEEKKNKEKLEKQEQKQKELEQKQKEKELKEEQKRKEREEKELKKKEKEEQRKKEREQERLKKQQEIEEKTKEKLKQEEQKQKAAAAFVNFFVAKKTEVEDKKSEENQNSLFKNFEVKSDMRLPPKRRPSLTDLEKKLLIDSIAKSDEDSCYLKNLSNKKCIRKCGKTWPYDPSDEVTIIEDDNVGETICEEKSKQTKLKAKFLKFHENQRPPYFGTWRKKSPFVKPRRPFGQDQDILNYEEDSDDDWEQEGQGESLDESDGEDKENEPANDDYEVDNDFFVPHGHLSDDEIDDEAISKLSPESQKQKLKLLKDEFDKDIKSKTNKIQPRFIGCIWYDKDGKHVDEPIDRYLKPLAMISNGIVVIKKRNGATLKTFKKKTDAQLKEMDIALIPEFIKLVHGNINKRKTLVSEFLSYMNEKGLEGTISKASLSRNVKHIAEWMKCPEEGPMYNKFCWFVPQDIRKKYNLDLTLPNQWDVKLKN